MGSSCCWWHGVCARPPRRFCHAAISQNGGIRLPTERQYLFATPCIMTYGASPYWLCQYWAEREGCLQNIVFAPAFDFLSIPSSLFLPPPPFSIPSPRIGHGSRAGIFKLLRSPRIDSKEPIPQGCVAWRDGTTTLFLLSS